LPNYVAPHHEIKRLLRIKWPNNQFPDQFFHLMTLLVNSPTRSSRLRAAAKRSGPALRRMSPTEAAS
jgi:hypothetical protein